MQVDFEQALEFFETVLGERFRSPYLHPYYVAADANRDDALEPVYLTYREDAGAFYYAFHLGTVAGHGLSDIQSPYGYGGPVCTTQDAGFLERAWRKFGEWCRDHSVLAEFVRFHPLLDNRHFFAGEAVMDRETVWIDLSVPNLLASYSTRARTAIRKAEKNGLRVEWWGQQTFFPIFRELYREHITALNADAYYFFPDEYLKALVSWKDVQLGVCVLDGEVLAAAIFLRGPLLLEYHLSAASRKGKQLSATNLLIHEAALWGRASGCSKLHLGGGTNAAEDNPLLFFKSGFSEMRSPFYIGKRVHLPEDYRNLKANWEIEHGRVTNRVLFYR